MMQLGQLLERMSLRALRPLLIATCPLEDAQEVSLKTQLGQLLDMTTEAEDGSLGASGLGFGVWRVGFRVQGLRFRV